MYLFDRIAAGVLAPYTQAMKKGDFDKENSIWFQLSKHFAVSHFKYKGIYIFFTILPVDQTQKILASIVHATTIEKPVIRTNSTIWKHQIFWVTNFT